MSHLQQGKHRGEVAHKMKNGAHHCYSQSPVPLWPGRDKEHKLYADALEGALLEQLRGELVPDPQQYGGLKECGAKHMLIDVWENVLGDMDGGNEAVVLLGVDFQKVFNRMEFTVCLEQLERLGASPGSRSMVKSFLTNRWMRMTLGNTRQRDVEILRGSPQGSVLGGALYCSTTQSLQDGTLAPRG